MIKLWLDRRVPLYIYAISENGFVRLSKITWFKVTYDCCDIEIDTDFLNRGFKI